MIYGIISYNIYYGDVKFADGSISTPLQRLGAVCEAFYNNSADMLVLQECPKDWLATNFDGTRSLSADAVNSIRSAAGFESDTFDFEIEYELDSSLNEARVAYLVIYNKRLGKINAGYQQQEVFQKYNVSPPIIYEFDHFRVVHWHRTPSQQSFFDAGIQALNEICSSDPSFYSKPILLAGDLNHGQKDLTSYWDNDLKEIGPDLRKNGGPFSQSFVNQNGINDAIVGGSEVIPKAPYNPMDIQSDVHFPFGGTFGIE